MTKTAAPKKSKPVKRPVACERCGGAGNYLHFGTCFRCGGNGSDPTAKELVFANDWSAEDIEAFYSKKMEQAEARRLKREEKIAAAAPATFASNIEQAPSLQILIDYVERMEAAGFGSPMIYRDLIENASRRILSDSQISYIADLAEQVGDIEAAIQARIEEKRLEEEAEAVKAARSYLGEIGDQIEIVASVARAFWVDNRFGGSFLITLEEEGTHNEAIIWTTAKAFLDLQAGDRVHLTAEIKDRQMYEGSPQTTLARPKMVIA
jgi:hypothetical protein